MSKGKGTGSKHSTSQAVKALHAARGKAGYCVPPEKGKFRAGDGRKRGPGKKEKTADSAPWLNQRGNVRMIDNRNALDSIIVELGGKLVTLTENGGARDAQLIEALHTKLADDALRNPRERARFMRLHEKILDRKKEEEVNARSWITGFIQDAHSGRNWRLNDVLIKELQITAAALHDRELFSNFMTALNMMDLAIYEKETSTGHRREGIIVVPMPKGPPASAPSTAPGTETPRAANDASSRTTGQPSRTPEQFESDDEMTPGVDWRMGGRAVHKPSKKARED